MKTVSEGSKGRTGPLIAQIVQENHKILYSLFVRKRTIAHSIEEVSCGEAKY
jgi:hypothetical protein